MAQTRQRRRGSCARDNKLTDEWPAEAKFAVVLETAALSEIELSEYCRRQGSLSRAVQQWRKPVFWASNPLVLLQQAEKAQAKADKKRIRQLEQELRRKDKALAEAAALLILQKARCLLEQRRRGRTDLVARAAAIRCMVARSA